MAMLPKSFLDRMEKYLGEEFDAFVSSYDLPVTKGIRVNELKCTPEKLIDLMPIKLFPSPFCSDSFYSEEEIKVGFNPLHSAGAFYSQEPSASVPVELLDPKPGDLVLDMCAAPGGKTTQIASKLKGEGLIICNEVVKSRANILLSNVERMGIANAVVTSSYPEKIAEVLPEYFDKIVVDAPCSGEGMFRKNNEAITEWSPEHVESCAVRQLAILNDAADCLKKGGTLVYSTCTFSYEENEGVISAFLKSHPDFELVPVNTEYAHSGLEGMPVVRIYPMDGGEGHFAAKLRKLGEYEADYEIRNDKKIEKIEADTKGYTAVCVNGITIGFGKASNGRLKNKYPKGLRYH